VVRNSDLLRKPLQGTVILGRWPSAPDITTLTAVDGITLPVGYESAGWISEDGLTFGSDMEVSEVRGWGASSMLRRDIASTDKTMAFSALETKRLTKELTTGLDLSTTTMGATGQVVITHPDRMPTKYWRALALGVDGDGDQRYYMAKFYPKCSVSEREEEGWSDGDDPLMYGVTLSALIDDSIGTSCREFLFGPGALAAAAAMGWALAPGLVAPTGLASGTVAATTVVLNWTAVTGAASYQVQRSTNNGDTYTDVASGAGGTPTANTTTITGLTATTGYRFRVLAVGPTGNRSPASTSIGVTTA